MSLLVGTDFNEGIKGIGPKTALKLIKEHGTLESTLEEKGFTIENLDAVREIFHNPQVRAQVDLVKRLQSYYRAKVE